MKMLTLLFAYFLLSFPSIGNAQDDPNVNVKVNTPVGQVEVNKPPPPQPVVVVQPQPAQKVVVEKEAPPPAPSAGCNCSLIPSHASALGLLSLAPAFSIPFVLRRRKGSE